MIYYKTKHPVLLLATGHSLTHPTIVGVEKIAFANPNLFKLVEINVNKHAAIIPDM